MTLESFIHFCEEMGLDFPCSSTEFVARASYFLVINGVGPEAFETALDDICCEGIGTDWRD